MSKKFEVDEAIGDHLAPGYRLLEIRKVEGRMRHADDLVCRDCLEVEAIMVTDAPEGATAKELMTHRILCQDCSEYRGLVEAIATAEEEGR